MQYQANNIDDRIKALEQRKKALERHLSNSDRKARTKRLIETGALAEKFFEIDHLSLSQKEEFFKTFANYIKANTPSKFKKQK